MAIYRLPDFNLTCGITTNTGDFLTSILRLTSPCQLRGPQQGPRVGLSFGNEFIDVCTVPLLLLPPLTNIWDATVYGSGSRNCDLVEVPFGSGRWYSAFYVDDIAKGFPNEHRYALLSKQAAGVSSVLNMPTWPNPIP